MSVPLAGLLEKPNFPFSDFLVPAGTGDLEKPWLSLCKWSLVVEKPTTNGAVVV